MPGTTSNKYFIPGLYAGTSRANGLDQVLDHLKGCNQVLDFGCGTGIHVDFLNRKGINTHGFDPLEEAAGQVRSMGYQCHTALPVLTDYDGLMMWSVIEHIPIEQLGDLLDRFEGTIVIETVDPRVYHFMLNRSFWHDFSHVRPYTMTAVERLLIFHGFEIIDKQRVRSDLMPKVREKLQKLFRRGQEASSGSTAFPPGIASDRPTRRPNIVSRNIGWLWAIFVNRMISAIWGIQNPFVVVGIKRKKSSG